MATFNLFGAAVPANPNETDADGSYGVVVDIAAGCSVIKARWRVPDTLPSGPVTWHLHELASGDLIVEHTFTGLIAGQWIEEDVTPTAIAADVRAIAWVGTPDRYTATGGYFNGHSDTSGPLTAPATETVANGRFGGDPESIPNGTFNGGNYWVDLVAEIASPEGVADLGLVLTLATTGQTPHAGTAAFGLGLALATTGDAPTIDPNEGDADFPLEMAFSGTGETPAVGPAEGAAAFGLGLALATTGDAPAIDPGEGDADFPLALSFSGTGLTPVPGESDGTAALGLTLTLSTSGTRASEGAAAFSLALALATSGDNGAPFVCRPVRSFREVMPV
jgi:hypothetical protein